MAIGFTSDQLSRFARTVVEAVRSPTIVLDDSLTVVAANSAFAKLVKETRLTGKRLFDLAGGELDQPELRNALERTLPEDRSFDDVEVALPDGTKTFVSGKALSADTSADDELIVIGFDAAAVGQRTDDALESDWLFRAIVDTVRGLSEVLCLRPVSSLADEPFAENDGKLSPCLGPFARRSFPFLGRVIEDQI